MHENEMVLAKNQCVCVCVGCGVCVWIYILEKCIHLKNKRIQIISHDWIPGNKFIVCCITFQIWSNCPKMLACFLITAKKKKKVEHEKIPCFTRLTFVIGFSLQLQKVKFEGDLKHLRNW